MIVSFFARGSSGGGGGGASVDYLLGEERDREGATLLSGDPEETVALIDASNYAKTYTSGVLSFEEATITDEQKRAVMASFEECLLPGLDKDQYNVLWVEHTDKGRVELNFVIPNIELTTGKRLQPYYHGADMKRVDAWRTIQNLEHGFSDPDDPAKRQSLVLAKDLPRNKKEAAEAINDGLHALAERGSVTSRDDVVEVLEQAGFEIARQTKQSISIKDPDGGRNIRLRGALYEQDFGLSKDLQGDIEQRSREHKQSATARLEAARERYSYGIRVKQADLEKRYKREQRSVKAGDLQQSKTHEFGFVQDMGLGDRAIDSSSAWADRLEHVAGLNHLRPEPSHSAREANPRGLARGLGASERERGNVFNSRRENEEKTRSLAGTKRQLGNQSEQINDGNREIIIGHVADIKRRSRRSKKEYAERLGELREQAEADAKRDAEQHGAIGDAYKSFGEIERAGGAVERAKHGIDRAVTAVNQFIQAVKEKVQEKARNMGFSR